MPAGSPVTLYDSGEIPELDEILDMYPRQHATLGRVWTLERLRGGSSLMTLLFDQENDGVFESVSNLSRADYKATFPPEDFVDDFIVQF
jgi:hypothetical protein